MRLPLARLRLWLEAALLSALSSCGGPNARATVGVSDAATQAADHVEQTERPSGPPPPPRDDPEASVITLSAIGDCALGDLQNVAGAPGSFAARLGSEDAPMRYPFSGVGPIFHDDDVTVANLEGVLSERLGFANPVFSIRGEPGYAEMLKLGGVDVVNLANNHSHDYGHPGHEDTKAALRQASVGFFGHGNVDRRPIKGIVLVSLGYLGGPAGTLSKMTADVRRESGAGKIVVVSFHWGVEGSSATLYEQRKLGRAAIDAGADLVLGHHPHVLQGIESYHQRHIVYSLGNFVFGANSQPENLDSVIVQERFHLQRGVVASVEQRLVPVRISGDLHQNDFRPVLLAGADRERVLSELSRLSRAL